MTWTVNYNGEGSAEAVRQAFDNPTGEGVQKWPDRTFLRKLGDAIVEHYVMPGCAADRVSINVTGHRQVRGVQIDDGTEHLSVSVMVQRQGIPYATMHRV